MFPWVAVYQQGILLRRSVTIGIKQFYLFTFIFILVYFRVFVGPELVVHLVLAILVNHDCLLIILCSVMLLLSVLSLAGDI